MVPLNGVVVTVVVVTTEYSCPEPPLGAHWVTTPAPSVPATQPESAIGAPSERRPHVTTSPGVPVGPGVHAPA